MIRKNRFLFLLLLVVLMPFIGCVTPGQESFDLGKQLVGQNRLEEAIVKYEQALALEPDNPEYKKNLDQAKGMVAGRLKEKIKAILAQSSITIDQLKKAYEDAAKALKLMPRDKEAQDLVAKIKFEMDASDKKAQRLATEAAADIEKNEWAAAVTKMREIKRIFPSDAKLPAQLSTIEKNGMAYYQREAQKYQNSDDWDRVLKAYEGAQVIAPADREIQKGVKEAREKNTPDYYLSRGESFSKQGRWDQTTGYIRKAKVLDTRGANESRIKNLSINTAEYFVGQAQKDPKKMYSAYGVLMLASEYRGDPRVKVLTDQMLDKMYEKAAAYDTNGQLGNAFAWYEFIGKVNPEYKDIFVRTQDIRDRIRDRVIKKIAIMDFTSPAAKPDAGRLVTDSLLAYFTGGSVKNVKILARDVLGAVLKEIEMGQAGLFDIESAKKAGRLKGTDVFIFGSVLQYNVETSAQEGQKMANVVVGKKSVANPAYQMWLMLPKDKPKEGSNLSSMLPPPAPPATIEEEIRETVKYKVGTSKKRAVVSVSFRLVDVEEGQIVTSQTIKKVVDASDDFSEGVSMANIPYDPLNLPSDSELLDKATQEVVISLGRAVISHFENPRTLYLNSADGLVKKRSYEKAVEKYVDALFFDEIRGTSGTMPEAIRKDIAEVMVLMGN